MGDQVKPSGPTGVTTGIPGSDTFQPASSIASEGVNTKATANPSTEAVSTPGPTPGNVVIPGSSEVTTPGSTDTCHARNVVSFVPLNSGNEYQESDRISSASERANIGNPLTPVTSDVFICRFPGKAEATLSKAFSTMVSTFSLKKNQPLS